MKTFAITKPSAISGTCILGTGSTKSAAWEDAYGPKPWSSFAKKSASTANCIEVTEDELADMREASANR
jgi:hypothetical protein